MKQIRMLIMDVDGTLTDGKIYMSPSGEAFKAFSAKDGAGIRYMLPSIEIIPVILTGRSCAIVARRAESLGITYLFQDVRDKARKLRELGRELGIAPEEMAYIGDDINDLDSMALCGIGACPADAVEAVRQRADFVCTQKGGDGAVREFIEYLAGLYRGSIPAPSWWKQQKSEERQDSQ